MSYNSYEKSAAYKAYFRKYGKPYRDRSPKEIHEALQRLFSRSNKMGEINSKWFNDTPPCFIAKYTPKDREVQTIRIVGYDMDHKERSHSNFYSEEGRRDREWAKALLNEDLPLYIHDDTLSDEVKGILAQRMKGERPAPVLRQDLHDRKVLIDNKWRRVRMLTGAYLELIKKYAEDVKYKTPSRYDFTKLYVVEIEGYEYVFDGRLSYISSAEIRRLKL